MERKDFLRAAGAIGLGSVIPLKRAAAVAGKLNSPAMICTLVPSETAGPYPLNLSGNAAMFRQDIRETQPGVDLRFRIKIFGINNCGVIQNARVDVWHCSADGYYSGYTTSGQLGSQNHVGQTFLRGIQMTDVNGEVEFLTKFPGWYSGRITHIHFQVYITSILQVTSQFTFPIADKNALYAAHAPYSTYGPDPILPANDNVFSDGYSLQMATLTYNSVTNEYESYFEAGINSSGTVGLQHIEPETGGQFKLMQNYPNPYRNETTIPFTLTNLSQVKISLFDLSGKKVAEVNKGNMSKGKQEVLLNIKSLGIPKGNYIYQLDVANEHGLHSQCKMMSASTNYE